jgi:hypothetical protein
METTILVLISDPIIGRRIVERELSEHPHVIEPVELNRPTAVITRKKSEPDLDGLIPWRISNRYYDADINFQLKTISADENSGHIFNAEIEGSPAIIYAFETGAASTRLVATSDLP